LASGRDLDVMLGDPRKAIAAMFVPLFAALAVGQINTFVDTFFTSGLGVAASSGLAAMVPVYDIFQFIGVGMSVGATTTIAFRLGKKDLASAGRLASQTIRWSIILSAASSILVLLLTDPIIDMMGSGEVREHCWSYLLPFILLSPTIIVYQSLGGMLRGEGAAKRSTIIQVSAALLNMVLDPILIYGFGWGLAGASLSTCIAYAVSLAIGLRWYIRGETAVSLSMRRTKDDRGYAKELFEIAGPKTGEQLAIASTYIFQLTFLAIAGGTLAILLYNLPSRYTALINLPTTALTSAMIPVCAAALGSRDLLKMREGLRFTLKWSLTAAIILSAILFVFADYFAIVFTYEESMMEIRPQLAWALRMFALMTPTNCIRSFLMSSLQSMKRPKDAMYFIFLWSVLKLIVFAYFCQYGFEAILVALVTLNYIGILINYWLYRRGIRLTEEAIASAS